MSQQATVRDVKYVVDYRDGEWEVQRVTYESVIRFGSDPDRDNLRLAQDAAARMNERKSTVKSFPTGDRLRQYAVANTQMADRMLSSIRHLEALARHDADVDVGVDVHTFSNAFAFMRSQAVLLRKLASELDVGDESTA
jgi:hypothetical protein